MLPAKPTPTPAAEVAEALPRDGGTALMPEFGELDEWLDRILRIVAADPIPRPAKPAVWDPNEPTKRCRQCNRRKPVSHFARRSRSADGYTHCCTACVALRRGRA